MFDPIDLSAYANASLSELASGTPQLDGTILLDMALQAKGPVLELGCSYGRITIPMAERGVTDLTGLELSAPSLAHACTKAGDLPIQWVEADVRDFHLDRQYAFIFARGCVFDFMLTRKDQEAMLACVHTHLTDDGQFLLDTCTMPPHEMVHRPEPFEWYTMTHPNGRQIYVSGTYEFDYTRQLWIQRCYERWDSPDGELAQEPWTLTLRYTMPQDLAMVLYYNGFNVVAIYGDYEGNPVTQENPSHIYLCEKRL
ncbi:MAG: class I SAM-dependent methyltransferase [Chloroflexota bacterium]